MYHTLKKMNVYWGEISPLHQTDSGIASLERECPLKMCPMDLEGPPLYRTSHPEPSKSQELLSCKYFDVDVAVLHTIKLLSCESRLKTLIDDARQKLDNIKNGESNPSLPPAPQLTQFDLPPLKHQIQRPVPFLPNNFDTPFSRGISSDPPPPEISSTTCRRLLKKSVATIFAHSGVENAKSSVLETMTDIADDYLTTMTRLLRQAVDRETQTGSCGFPDAMERVFYDMGIGSKSILHDFYQKRVVQYRQNVLDRCEQLRQEYEKLRSVDTRSVVDRTLEVKKEGSLSDLDNALSDEIERKPSASNDDFSPAYHSNDNRQPSSVVKCEPMEVARRTSSLEMFDLSEGGSSFMTEPPPLSSSHSVGREGGPGSVFSTTSDLLSPLSAGARTTVQIIPPKKKRK